MTVSYHKALSFELEDMDTPLKCDLCEGEKNIQFRCYDCKKKICAKCKIIHSNAKASKSHTILSFSDADCSFLDIQLKKRIKTLPCINHPHTTYTLFCKTCNCLICITCVPIFHLGHHIYGIDQFMDEKLRSEQKEVSEKLPRGFLARSPSYQEDSCITADFIEFHTLKTDIPQIFILKTESTTDTVWIGCLQTKNVERVKLPLKSKRPCLRFLYKKINKDMDVTKLDQIEDFEVLDMILMNKDILFVTSNDHNLKLAFTDSFNQKQIHNIQDFQLLEPISLHFDKSNKLYWIGFRESENPIYQTTKTRKIVGFSETWEAEQTFEYTTNGKRLFTNPFRIGSAAGQILVLDRTSKTTGRVVSLNLHGHRTWEYEDPKQTTMTVRPFLPTAIATTKDNKILVIDAANSALHILNTAGNMMVFKSLLDLSIERPFSLDIDDAGRLWIGTACDLNAEERKASIHVIGMSII